MDMKLTTVYYCIKRRQNYTKTRGKMRATQTANEQHLNAMKQ